MTDSVQTILGIAGWKNSGKTTLIVGLVRELTRRGFRISSVKHAHHAADMDKEGSDSFQHREAGSAEVMLVTAKRWMLAHEFHGEPEPSLQELVAHLAPADLIIVEGYKSAEIPKIEVRGPQGDREAIAKGDPHVIAVAGVVPAETGDAPFFLRDDIAGIADFLVRRLNLRLDADADDVPSRA